MIFTPYSPQELPWILHHSHMALIFFASGKMTSGQRQPCIFIVVLAMNFHSAWPVLLRTTTLIIPTDCPGSPQGQGLTKRWIRHELFPTPWTHQGNTMGVHLIPYSAQTGGKQPKHRAKSFTRVVNRIVHISGMANDTLIILVPCVSAKIELFICQVFIQFHS